ncbi:hypothetical protein AWV80_41465 [Cupriavidus sp. UYMU48A]|nr:hypothetical protein AWV80_31365 [Cupriavidus sp. UYMU48A]KAF7964148.1 hypothetical protein AWV80_41465 [Cupriavidus sp. UYMU48A]
MSLKNTCAVDCEFSAIFENACASGSTAFHLAYNAVRSGQAQVALVVGAERMTHEDKRVSFGALAKAVDLEEELPKHVGSGSGSIFMDIYAEKTRKYMAATGCTREDLAQIVVKSRRAASLNPVAQFRTPTTVEEVLASRVISDPLTLQMCSSIGDGAAAVVLCSPEFLKTMCLDDSARLSSVIANRAAHAVQPGGR